MIIILYYKKTSDVVPLLFCNVSFLLQLVGQLLSHIRANEVYTTLG